MVIQPKVRGFLCTTTHPTGCFEIVRRQAEQVRSKGVIAEGPKRVLVLGASTGYGLASRITAAFGSGASTIGVFFGNGQHWSRPRRARERGLDATRWEQDEAKLAKHRNFDSHVVARDQTEQRKLAAGRRAATNAFEGRDNRVFELGAVGWGVVGTHEAPWAGAS